MKHLLLSEDSDQRSTFVTWCSTAGCRDNCSGVAPPRASSINGSGQEYPLDIGTLQYGSELCNALAGLEWGIDGGPTIYLVAEILALADHLGGGSYGAADWPDAAFFGVV